MLSYAEYQFGEAVTGKDYRIRVGGERIYKMMVDIDYLNDILTAD